MAFELENGAGLDDPKYLERLHAKYRRATRPSIAQSCCAFICPSFLTHRINKDTQDAQINMTNTLLFKNEERNQHVGSHNDMTSRELRNHKNKVWYDGCTCILEEEDGNENRDLEENIRRCPMSRRTFKMILSTVYFVILVMAVITGSALLIYGLSAQQRPFIVAGSIVCIAAGGLCLNHCFTMTIGQARSRTEEERHIQKITRNMAVANGWGTAADGTTLVHCPLLDRRLSLQASLAAARTGFPIPSAAEYPLLAAAGVPRCVLYNAGAGRRYSRRQSNIMDFARAFSFASYNSNLALARTSSMEPSRDDHDYNEFS